MPQQRIEYGGEIHEFPDSFTDADIAKALKSVDGSKATTSQAAPSHDEGLLNALGRAASSYWEQVNPWEMVKGAAKVVTDLPGVASGLLDAQKVPFDKAKESFGRGAYAEGARHTLSYLLPIIGPQLDIQSDKAQSGDVAGAIGGTLGLGTALLAPEAAKMLPKSAKVGALAANANPVERAAVAFGQREGIPIDAATATGNKVVKAVQHVADRSLGGGMVAERARAAQAEALASTGQRLAGRSGPAQTAEQAGQGVSGALKGEVSKQHGLASTEYDKLRQFEADPAHTTQVPVPETPKPKSSSPVTLAPVHEARLDDLWADAKKHGYTGSRQKLVERYQSRLDEAREVAETLSDPGGGGATHGDLLHEISKAGGFGIELEQGGGYAGELENLIEGLNKSKGVTRTGDKLARGFTHQSGGLQGSSGIIVRKGGMTADRMLEHISEDPRWAGKFDNLSDFMEAVRESIGVKNGTIARTSPNVSKVPAIMRDVLGVKEGAKWWDETPKTKPMGLAVDLAPFKSVVEPIYQQMLREAELVPPMGAKGEALKAMDRLMRSPQHAPLSVVDGALGDLKAMARSQGDLPELRNHAVGQAIENLDLAVKLRAGEAGPEVLQALESGRKATRAKYAAADVLDDLMGGSVEPVKAYDRVTAPRDSRIALTRKIQQLAPNEVPKVARAYLDRLLDKATSEGGFGRAKGIAADWDRLGPETKSVLFRDPAYVKDLDNFFTLAKRMEDNPNPSGTAHTLLVAGQGGLIFTNPITGIASQVGLGALSKLMHSKAGVKLLTQGLTIPLRAKVPAMALRAKLLDAGLEPVPALSPSTAQGSSDSTGTSGASR